MTGAVDVLNVAIAVALLPVLVIVGRRPARRWRTGWAGKLVSLSAVLFVNFHLGDVLIPVGALVVFVRHRRDQEDSSPVPLADSWPGA